MCFPFKMECLKYFRLPFVGLAARMFFFFPRLVDWAIRFSAKILERWFWAEKYATEVVVRLVKT